MPHRPYFSICLILILLLNGPASFATNEQTVILQFDYGNGFSKQYKTISLSRGDTVLDAMKSMQKHPQKIPFKTRGSGELTFIFEIDMIRNEGNGKNWMFYVNGQRANVGVGAYKLQANDLIAWKYEVFQQSTP